MSNYSHMPSLLKHLLSRGVPGNACLISVNGQLRYSGCFGQADIEAETAVAADTVFQIFSLTKPMTCAAALRLFERGMYSLNDPLYEYMPEFRDAQVWRGPGLDDLSPAASPVLVRHLFTMTSGYTYGEPQEPGAARITYRNIGCDHFNVSLPLDEFCRRMAASPLAFDPGTGWRYGYNHDILGGFIQTLTGKPLSRAMQDEVFDPIGMTDTAFKLDTSKQSCCAAQYVDIKGRIKRKEISSRCLMGNPFESGGGGLLSTADDCLKFAAAMAAGDNALLNRKTVGMMRTDWLTPRQRQTFDWPHYAGYGYGLGVRVMTDTAAGASNGSIGEFGWCGAAGCWTLIDPDESLAAVYMQQLMPSGEAYFAPRLRAAIYSGL
jgi:CubicO group peptidase (beta-lactamase class C family)